MRFEEEKKKEGIEKDVEKKENTGNEKDGEKK
jgi:hypothetical protein